ncbi:FAD-dependent oxidoreductase [Microbulbifer bruguierae]|uniref:FAD-dependent oxidoreductase n=1 Tax=Microbulbifer bruguierae TaxID=3029061 RepID=A0ABY8ND30_9GAMM|nr:FAD-dependent oxidoreductase [Microbulbifer bruguierae]WGL16821.1 FAD-dependent oxidoreductase [Microbulbifer bruguierae]
MQYRVWECLVCGWVYDEEKGAPEEGIAPGTRWEDIPSDWLCPECGVGKGDFEMVEVRSVESQPEKTNETEAAAVPTEAVAELTEFSAQIDYTRKPIVIVGTGLAGYNLAREIRKLDTQTPLILISADDGTYYSKPQLSTAFQKRRTPLDLMTSDARTMAQSLAAEIMTFTRVQAINSAEEYLTLESAGRTQQLAYARLVLAVGADTVTAPLEGNASGAAVPINDLQDFQRFYAASAGTRSVLIIGGGLIGCEYANDLVQAGFTVHVVEPQSEVLATLLPAPAGQLVNQCLTTAGVNFHLGTRVVRLERHQGQLLATLENGEQILCDRAISAIGVRARTQLAEQAGLKVARGIVTDRLLQTSAENIYALGDCAEVDGRNLCYVAPLLAGARALAQTLCGNPTEVRYDAMPVTIKTTLCPVTVSPARPWISGSWEIQRADSNGVRAVFVDSQGLLQGFALCGDAVSEAARLTEQVPALLQN